jgi:thiamine-monophosphate kinase
MMLREVGEDRMLAQLLPTLSRNSSVVLGAGDDCAVVKCPQHDNLQLLKTDCIVEGIHFTATSPPASVGWKAMARPLSDFAAMSGVPQFALVSLIVPAERALDWTRKIYRGLEKAARAFRVAIVGGDTSNIKGPAVISVSMTGFVEKSRWIGRDRGKANDELLVTGRLGGSLRGRHLKFTPRIEEARWLTKHFPIHAMMDLSDGLGADLPRLARASGVGFEVDEDAIPRQGGCSVRHAIGDGEDYELLFAVSPKVSAELQRRWGRRWSLKLTRIGRLTKAKSLPENWPAGYVHFK